jgi:hypothetical protein
MGTESAAGLGQSRSPAQAIEQGRPQFLLEQAEPATDGRLRAVQTRAGPREATQLGNGDESLKTVDVHDRFS